MWEKIKGYVKEQSGIERKKLKEMTFLEKISYIWEYYKIQIIIITIVCFVTGSIIHNILNPPTPAFANVIFYEVFVLNESEIILDRIRDELIEDTNYYEIYAQFLNAGGDPAAAQHVG